MFIRGTIASDLCFYGKKIWVDFLKLARNGGGVAAGGGGGVRSRSSSLFFCLFVFFYLKFNILLLFCIISIHKIREKSISKQSALSLFLIGKCIILILLRCQDYRYPSDSRWGLICVTYLVTWPCCDNRIANGRPNKEEIVTQKNSKFLLERRYIYVLKEYSYYLMCGDLIVYIFFWLWC